MKTDRKGKHQMFKTLITSVINTIQVVLIRSVINPIWIGLITSDVINHNCHNLILITSGVINTSYLILIT